ncbi:hypothetical protein ACHAXH_005820 [Discostella pseudostelligera]
MESCICPRATICADDLLSMIFLTIARSLAWFNYPLYMMMFLSKAKYLDYVAVLDTLLGFASSHAFHIWYYCWTGKCEPYCFSHFEMGSKERGGLYSGITCMIAIGVLPLIILPMVVPFLKCRISSEWCKSSMH